MGRAPGCTAGAQDQVNRAPWEAFSAANPDPLNNQVFQLYNLNNDFNQTSDIAAANPQKVKQMRAEFLVEAKKYPVLPLDASVAARLVAPRPNLTAVRSEYVYTHPMVGPAAGRFAPASEHVVHRHGGHHGARGRR